MVSNNKLEESVKAIDPEGGMRNRAKTAALAAGAATVAAYNQILAASPAFGELPLSLKRKI